MDGTIRIRTLATLSAAVVLSVVCTLVVMQAVNVAAEGGDDGSTFVPVEPCRLFDFRPGEEPDGPKKTPLGAGAINIYTQQITGAVGNCVIPDGAAAVAMNVTIANPTAQSNLRVYPGDVETVPTVASLNWLPGQSPTPNKVDVALSPTGTIKLFNAMGSVDVIADVVGYYSSNVVTDFEVVTVNQNLNLNTGDFTGFEAACPGGKKVTGGGMSISENDGLEFRRSIPNTSLSSWIGGVTGGKTGASGSVTIYAICASGVVAAP